MNKLSKEVAERILMSKEIVNTPGRVSGKLRVTNISNQIFNWKESGDEYRIVNTNLMNDYLAAQAQELFENGEYDAACNKGLSVNVSLEDAEQLTKGGLAQCEVQWVNLKDGSEGLMIRTGSIKPQAAVTTRKFSFKKKGDDVKDIILENIFAEELETV